MTTQELDYIKAWASCDPQNDTLIATIKHIPYPDDMMYDYGDTLFETANYYNMSLYKTSSNQYYRFLENSPMPYSPNRGYCIGEQIIPIYKEVALKTLYDHFPSDKYKKLKEKYF